VGGCGCGLLFPRSPPGRALLLASGSVCVLRVSEEGKECGVE
jgi:hypothetical protein